MGAVQTHWHCSFIKARGGEETQNLIRWYFLSVRNEELVVMTQRIPGTVQLAECFSPLTFCALDSPSLVQRDDISHTLETCVKRGSLTDKVEHFC